jgi:hypothetical protein
VGYGCTLAAGMTLVRSVSSFEVLVFAGKTELSGALLADGTWSVSSFRAFIGTGCTAKLSGASLVGLLGFVVVVSLLGKKTLFSISNGVKKKGRILLPAMQCLEHSPMGL